MGVTVTRRAKDFKQPRGGLVPLKSFTVEHLEDGRALSKGENLNAGTVGMVVDNLARLLSKPASWSTGLPLAPVTPGDAFAIAFLGAKKISSSDLENAQGYANLVSGLDDASIVNACKLTAYEPCFRAGASAFKDPETMIPDQNTIENIRTMVSRCVEFFSARGPITCLGPIFKGGYTDTVSKGDGDLLTIDAIWDIKTSVKKPTPKDTLQVYMYYLMGKRSIEPAFEPITKIGVFNPRLHEAYTLAAEDISESVKDTVEREVIGY